MDPAPVSSSAVATHFEGALRGRRLLGPAVEQKLLSACVLSERAQRIRIYTEEESRNSL